MKKVLLSIFLMFIVVVSGCSCDKFSISTYQNAVKNFKESTGFEYELTITTEVKDQNYYNKDLYDNKYILTTVGKVSKFSSILKEYKISNPSSLFPSGNYELMSSLTRYYYDNKFYTKAKEGSAPETIKREQTTYEEKFSDLNDAMNVKNIVPLFENKDISQFKISGIKGKKGQSKATFVAAVPNFIESSEETTEYTVTMNKNLNFTSLKFVVINEDVTTTYEYKFGNYNSKVSIDLPSDF